MIRNQPQERTVLVVDDLPADRELARTILNQEANLSIRMASDGPQALQLVAVSQPDVIVTDLNMPEMDGFELIDVLRVDYPSIPIVVTTSSDDDAIAQLLHDRGIAPSKIVPKERCSVELAQTVSSLLQHREVIGDHDVNVPTEVRCCISNDPQLIPPTIELMLRPLLELETFGELGIQRIEMALEEVLFHSLYYGNLEMPLHQPNEKGTRGVAQDRGLYRIRCGQPPYRDRSIVAASHIVPEMAKFSVRHDGVGFKTRASSSDNQIPNSCLRLARTYMDAIKLGEDGKTVTMFKRLARPE